VGSSSSFFFNEQFFPGSSPFFCGYDRWEVHSFIVTLIRSFKLPTNERSPSGHMFSRALNNAVRQLTLFVVFLISNRPFLRPKKAPISPPEQMSRRKRKRPSANSESRALPGLTSFFTHRSSKLQSEPPPFFRHPVPTIRARDHSDRSWLPAGEIVHFPSRNDPKPRLIQNTEQIRLCLV